MFNYLKTKKLSNKQINKIYSQHIYGGMSGYLMRYCHKQLEKNLPNKKYKKILEIGAYPEPHLRYIKEKDFKYYVLEKKENKYVQESKSKYKINYKFYDGKKIPFKANFFDRIIISHTLEHIPNPNYFLIDMMSKLKKGGVLSIALPTDPGLLWRFSRLFNKVFILGRFYRKKNISTYEYDFSNAIEHINSVFNLISIIRYHYYGKILEDFLPFKIKFADLNLFYNVHITK